MKKDLKVEKDRGHVELWNGTELESRSGLIGKRRSGEIEWGKET